jgi:hypothetical protein
MKGTSHVMGGRGDQTMQNERSSRLIVAVRIEEMTKELHDMENPQDMSQWFSQV